ncbi:MAG: hypothetical protein IGS48_03870 [Oscillatoriales cyanobacterium C42_A2020_001]|nr:hypothetical protein [Leptolyngbyaceae cyanobacterium C42_A2020_001]
MKTQILPSSVLSTLFTQLNRFWSFLIDMGSRYPDVRVWQRRDRRGDAVWHGYDPTNGDYVSFGTEDEIRSWIEQRYYTRDRD